MWFLNEWNYFEMNLDIFGFMHASSVFFNLDQFLPFIAMCIKFKEAMDNAFAIDNVLYFIFNFRDKS